MSVGFLRYYNKSQPGAKLRSMFAVASMYNLDFFHFSPENVNTEAKTINGMFWSKEMVEYVRKEVPYPDIVDDQFNFRSKDRELYLELKEHCYLTYMPLGTKSAVFRKIDTTDFSKYLIKTYHFRDMDVANMLVGEKYIIKPDNGGRGENIYKLERISQDAFDLHFAGETRQMTLEELAQEYFDLFETRYIAQPFLDSTTIEKNPFDIRMHLRRGREGKWDTHLIYPRIGSSAGVVSNVATGGAVSLNHKSFLQQQFGDDWKRIFDELKHIADVFPKTLQKKYKKLIDSLALDVGIDRARGNELKFFEVNTYPGVQTYPYHSSEASIHFYMHLLNLKKEGKL
ncbi:MAG: YheC/YheD family protein [Defluviitaleaceae bacterium]|nr:YheC/YheD family protein [Defluviitaleaceae bacterium]